MIAGYPQLVLAAATRTMSAGTSAETSRDPSCWRDSATTPKGTTTTGRSSWEHSIASNSSRDMLHDSMTLSQVFHTSGSSRTAGFNSTSCSLGEPSRGQGSLSSSTSNVHAYNAHATTAVLKSSTTLGDHLGGRRRAASLTRSSAKSLSEVETQRRQSDVVSARRLGSYDDVKSLGNIAEAKRHSKKEKKKKPASPSSKSSKREKEKTESKSLSDLLSARDGTQHRDNFLSSRSTKLSTIPSQRRLMDNDGRSMTSHHSFGESRSIGDNRSISDTRSIIDNRSIGDTRSFGETRSSGDNRSIISETPQELAIRKLKMQQKAALRRQAETLDPQPKASPSLGAFFSKHGDEGSGAVVAPPTSGNDDQSDDNDTFFSMFQWSTADDNTKKKTFSGTKSVGGRSMSSGTNRQYSGSKSVTGFNGNMNESADISSVKSGRDRDRSSSFSGPIRESRNLGTTIGRSSRMHSSLGHAKMDQTSSPKSDTEAGIHTLSRSYHEKSRKSPESNSRRKSWDDGISTERRRSRKDSRSSHEKTNFSGEADSLGMQPQMSSPDDNVRKSSNGKSKSPRGSRKESSSQTLIPVATRRSVKCNDNHSDETVDRSSHSRLKSSTYDTDNDTKSRSAHSRRKDESTHSSRNDETKEERKERKKAEKKLKERRNSRKDIGSDDDGDRSRMTTGSPHGGTRRRSSSTHYRTDGEDTTKTKKKKKESHRKSESNEEGAIRRHRKSVDRDLDETSKRRSKSTPTDRDDKRLSRRSSKSVSADRDDKGVPRRRSKSVATVSDKKSPKHRKSIRPKVETVTSELTDADQSVASKLRGIAAQNQMNMTRTSAFDEDSGDDHSLIVPGAEIPMLVNGTAPDTSFQYKANIEDEYADGGDATVVHLSDTDDEDDNSQVSQVEAGEVMISRWHSDDLENVLLQFEPSERGNIERINHMEQSPGEVVRIQNSDGTHMEGIITGMPETSFTRANTRENLNAASKSQFTTGPESKGGLTPHALGRNKSMNRLMKRTGDLFRREKTGGDDTSTWSPHHSIGTEEEGKMAKESDYVLGIGDACNSSKASRPHTRRHKSGKVESPTDARSGAESASRCGVKSPETNRALPQSLSKSFRNRGDDVLVSHDDVPAPDPLQRRKSSRVKRRPST